MAITTFRKEIPQGYIGILRGIKWEFTTTNGNSIPDIGQTEWVGRLLVNGSPVPNYDNLQIFDRIVTDFIPCYALANSGQEFQLEFAINQAGASFDISAFMYGQELLSKDVPLELEPGTAEAVKGL